MRTPLTGMEYADTAIGDGGFILKFSDGTVTDANLEGPQVLMGSSERRHPAPEGPFEPDAEGLVRD